MHAQGGIIAGIYHASAKSTSRAYLHKQKGQLTSLFDVIYPSFLCLAATVALTD